MAVGMINPVTIIPSRYENVTATSTNAVLGTTGAAGDMLVSVLIVPASLHPGSVQIIDGTATVTIFTGGTSSINELRPIYLPLNLISVNGAWSMNVGASVAAVGIGIFSA